jgi:mannose-1-phosphate guanylyltransferase
VTSTPTPLPGLHAVVPAGGAGTRLWPLSRSGRPKFLLDLTGAGSSLLQQTWARLVPLTGPGRMLVVTGVAHAEAVAGQLPALAPGNLLAEPSPRESAAAICLAAAVVRTRDPEAVIGSFAADHVIRDVPAFHRAVTEAVSTAQQGYVVTIGVTPDRPATAYGYIRAGKPLEVPGAPSALAVERFVEKPDAATAEAYLAEGGYRWNAGMFVSRADVLLDQLRRHRPALYDGLAEIAAGWDGPHRAELLDRVWPGLEKVAIDYAVAEPAADAGAVAVVPADLGWDDVGDFSSLAALLPPGGNGDGPGGRASADRDAADRDATGLRVLGDRARVLSLDATGVVAGAGDRLIAVLGVDDVVVVDTPDAVLVTTRDRAQEVKKLVDRLRGDGRTELL